MGSLKRLPREVALVAFMALGLPASSHAADSASLELASGNSTQMLRIGAQWLWSKQWPATNGTHIGGYWDLTLAQWREQHYKDNPDASHNLVTIGLTPVFRFQQDSGTGFYAEAGIGLHVFSEPYDNNGHILSGDVQFGDHIGVGYVFNNKLDLSLKVQHFSNGGVKEPNDGINFVVVKIGHTF